MDLTLAQCLDTGEVTTKLTTLLNDFMPKHVKVMTKSHSLIKLVIVQKDTVEYYELIVR